MKNLLFVFSAVGCLLVNSCNNSNLTESHDRDAIVELTPAFIDSLKKYDRLGIYSEGYAAVCKEGKWGYINTTGEEVIPISIIDAKCVGRFAEGYAVVLHYWDAFSVINEHGQKVFTSNIRVAVQNSIDGNYESSDIPYYINGMLYFPYYNEQREIKFAVFDTEGTKLRYNVSQKEGEDFYKQNEVGDYTTFSAETKTGEKWSYTLRGIKNAVGETIIEPKYDDILTFCAYDTGWRYHDYRHKINNGVVLVELDEFIDRSNEEDVCEADRIDIIPHYAYADLKGNDTFSGETRRICQQSREVLVHFYIEDDIEEFETPTASDKGPEWLNGRWVYTGIDKFMYEFYYKIYVFSNGSYQFIQSEEEYEIPTGHSYGYYVDNNIIYDADGSPLFKINYNNKTLTRLDNSGETYKKQ